MTRLLRTIFNALTATSALLCLATVILWTRRTEWLFLSRPCAHVMVQADGKFGYGRMSFDEWNADVGDFSPLYSHMSALAADATLGEGDDTPQWFGIEVIRYAGYRKQIYNGQLIAEPLHVLYVGVPHWLAVALTGFLPSARLLVGGARAVRERRRRARGRCPACGYDVRATPDRCPECGTVATNKEEPTLRRGEGDER